MTRLPDVVTTVRLRLPVISPDEAARMRGGHREPSWHPGYPRQDDLDGISMIPAAGSGVGVDDLSWAPRHVVRAYDGLVVGSIGFFGPPAPEGDGVLEAEIGYGLVEAVRGAGYATEAVTAMVAAAEAEGARVRASVLPDNAASIRVLAKCGFTELRGSNEDGELVMARPLR